MIVVVGAGPAGIAAALEAGRRGVKAMVLDDNPEPGGQIWRGAYRFPDSRVEFIPRARVVYADAATRTLLAETPDRPLEMRYDKLILATGARELFLPFPGWTLPGVTGVGGLQAMAKGGLPLRHKRIVVAGSGPLLLAAAAYFRKAGAQVVLIAEQARLSSVLPFAAGKLGQAILLQLELFGVPYRFGCRPVRAEGEQRVQRVWFRKGTHAFSEDVDYAAIGWGLVPNTELARLLGCSVNGGVEVDELQQTSVPAVYCAGEATGIGGVDLAQIEGAIAGCAATGDETAARSLFRQRGKAGELARSLHAAFALGPELKQLPEPATIVCRCEDVRFGRLQPAASFREAKLHTRCGMGPCQGRICGPAARFLFGWGEELVRPPILPTSVKTLICSSQPKGDHPECTLAKRLPLNQKT
jgi:NADPH-dependent 2,4-dienoyl-CoA reductase/sulfur reductase-like enzyme